ncbi:hypothetical protein [Sorangium sp. So ce542]|uniref:hypothetical protein n=1 Tax=Sorangium sp. So ce542 TaxID=3133316 RepID=UPI003F5DC295
MKSPIIPFAVIAVGAALLGRAAIAQSHHRGDPGFPQFPPNAFLTETTFDKCSRNSLYIYNIYNERFEIHKNEHALVRLGSRRFSWYCGDSREWTTCAENTNMVAVWRAPSGRDITWHCLQVHNL